MLRTQMQASLFTVYFFVWFATIARAQTNGDAALLHRFQTEAPAAWDRVEAFHSTGTVRGTLTDTMQATGQAEIDYRDHGLGILSREKAGYFLVETNRSKIVRPGSRAGSAIVITPSHAFSAHRENVGDTVWHMSDAHSGNSSSEQLRAALLTQFGAYLVPFRFHPLVTNRDFFADPSVGPIELTSNPAEPHLIRASFPFTLSENLGPKVLLGVAVFDAAQNWELVEAEVRGGKSIVRREMQYRDDPKSGIQRCALVRRTLAKQSGVNRLTFTVTEFDATPPRDEAFRSSALGLPELTPEARDPAQTAQASPPPCCVPQIGGNSAY